MCVCVFARIDSNDVIDHFAGDQPEFIEFDVLDHHLCVFTEHQGKTNYV